MKAILNRNGFKREIKIPNFTNYIEISEFEEGGLFNQQLKRLRFKYYKKIDNDLYYNLDEIRYIL